MDNDQLYNDIKVRTGGELYLGVGGPVRTGKAADSDRNGSWRVIIFSMPNPDTTWNCIFDFDKSVICL